MKRESPFLTHESQPLRPSDGFKVDLPRLLRASPFAQTGIQSEAAAPAEWAGAGEADHSDEVAAFEPEQPGCNAEQPADFDQFEPAREFDWFDSREAMSDESGDRSAADSMLEQHSHDEWADAAHQESEDAAGEQLDADLSETLFFESFEPESFEPGSFESEGKELDEYEQTGDAQSDHACCGGGHS